MNIRRLLAGVLLAMLLAACAPDDGQQGAGSPTTHPSGHESAAPSESSEPANPYDY